MSKQLGKYIAAFGYKDKALIVLSATSGRASIISFANVIGVPAGIASAIFTLVVVLTTGMIKKLLSITRNKKKYKIKLKSIETIISPALIDFEISHE